MLPAPDAAAEPLAGQELQVWPAGPPGSQTSAGAVLRAPAREGRTSVPRRRRRGVPPPFPFPLTARGSHGPGVAPTVLDASLEFAPVASSIGAARRHVFAVLEEGDADPLLMDTALLVVSELATNAVVHARTPFEVRVRVEDDRIRLDVYDSHGPEAMQLRPMRPGPEDRRGGGLALVDSLCTEWGWARHQETGRKYVWCVLPR